MYQICMIFDAGKRYCNKGCIVRNTIGGPGRTQRMSGKNVQELSSWRNVYKQAYVSIYINLILWDKGKVRLSESIQVIMLSFLLTSAWIFPGKDEAESYTKLMSHSTFLNDYLKFLCLHVGVCVLFRSGSRDAIVAEVCGVHLTCSSRSCHDNLWPCI